MPKVSVCIPTYNMGRFVGQAIDSVLAQDFGDFELVVVDDGSTDDTPALCAQYHDRRMRSLRPGIRLGQAGNFNRCIEEAQGEYVTLLHADDLFLPGFLADRVARLSEHPEASIAFGAVQVIDSEGKRVSHSGRWKEDRVLDRRLLLEALLEACIVCPSSMMFRKAAARRAGGFDPNLTWGHDWEWDLRLAETGSACYAAEPLAAYRVHEGSGTADALRAASNGAQERRILEQTLARLISGDASFRDRRRPALRSLSRRHMYFAQEALLAGRGRATRHNLRYAASADPLMLARPTFWVLLASSFGPRRLYLSYRSLRKSPPAE